MNFNCVHKVAILITAGYNYNGAKGDIKVWNPYVERDDEWSNSRIAMENGPYYHYESVQSGWMVDAHIVACVQSYI